MVRVLNTLLTRLDEIERRANRKIEAGPGLYVPHETPERLILGVSSRATASGASQSIWGIRRVAEPTVGKAEFRVRPGTIGGVLPNNHNEVLSVNTGELWFLYASVTMSGPGVSSVALNLSTEPSLEAATPGESLPTSFDILLAAGVNYTACWPYSGNISVTPAALYAEPSGSGSIPFDFYYGFAVADGG